MRIRSLWLLGLGLSLGAAAIAACGGDEVSVFVGAPEAGPDPVPDPPPFGGTDGGLADGSIGSIDISPKNAVIDVVSGAPLPSLQYTATSGGAPVSVAWSIDRGELGTITVNDGLLKPRGTLGGKARVIASVGGKTIGTDVTIRVKVVQNGPAASSVDAGVDSGEGAGGRGGVGGNPEGASVPPAVLAVLRGTATADPGLKWVYPYDATVWPRGILAPQLQWTAGAQGDYDALMIRVAETNFSFEGTYAKNGSSFVNHPLPQSVWQAIAQSNEGEEVSVSLTFAKNGAAYGPIVEKWKIASAPLKGTVYYNSYGTKLASNFSGALGPVSAFGAATLGIRAGASDPILVAGDNRPVEGCRVCHSVSSNGASLITQRRYGGDNLYSAYDLQTKAETTMTPNGGVYSWPAMYPDGKLFFSDSSSMDGSSATPSALYDVPTGTGPVSVTKKMVTGLQAGLRAATPAFSHDGKALAFNLFGGVPGANAKTLSYMTFDKSTLSFGPVTNLVTPGSNNAALWPSFLPDAKSVVYQVETRFNGRDFGGTRGGPSCEAVGGCTNTNDTGTRAELWWVDLATKTPVRLDKLNGQGYLPTGPNTHGSDETLNYEPTVNPVPSGGYAWVVFTSRRLYGNIATINPWQSDPRYTDISSNPTTKKLWVAAVDLNAPPGTDPSHPAFYLPAQELLAGNMRGFWVVDPCKTEGNGCETGDECCGGYCRPGPAGGDGGGALVCSNQIPTCAQEFEKCTSAADCCGTRLQCINDRCATSGPR
jgi:hypothetical protein